MKFLSFIPVMTSYKQKGYVPMVSAPLKDNFTSTGAKYYAHQEAMYDLRKGIGHPIVTHIMPTDICQHTCAFCSVQTREGDILTFSVIQQYLESLKKRGLKAVIISGGGNPLLYRCPESKVGIEEVIFFIKYLGLEIGMITNGAPMKSYGDRVSWKQLSPQGLDQLTWVRISMSGLDHKENEVYVPDVNPSKTALGFSYVLHDIYKEPKEPNHGKVSRPIDLITFEDLENRTRWWHDRLPELTKQLRYYVMTYKPRYLRLLPNCLEPSLIDTRCEVLRQVARDIDPDIVFVQYKPPASPNVCYLGYVHPVLNSDGYVYPCDSCVLNERSGHKFDKPWRMCKWDEIDKFFDQPVHSLVDPKELCPGCVFTKTNMLLEQIRNGAEIPIPSENMEHVNFI